MNQKSKKLDILNKLTPVVAPSSTTLFEIRKNCTIRELDQNPQK